MGASRTVVEGDVVKTQLELHLGSLNLSDARHKEQALGPKRLVCIQGIG